MGWSQGAQDVAAYIGQFGTESLSGVVLVDSVVSHGSNEVDAHQQSSKMIVTNITRYLNDPAVFSRGMVKYIFKMPHPDLDVDEIVKFTMQTPPDIGASMLFMDMFGADRQASLAKLRLPALVIASAESPYLDGQKEMASAIPGAQFVSIEEASHAVFVDQPARFDAAVLAFLKTIPAWSPAGQH